MADLPLVSQSRREVQTQAPTIGADSFGAGVGLALGQLGRELETTSRLGELSQDTQQSLRHAEEDRMRKRERAQSRVALLRLRNDINTEAEQMYRDSPPGAENFTNDVTEMASGRLDEYLRSLPEYLQTEFAVDIENARLDVNKYGRTRQISSENQQFLNDTDEMFRQYSDAILEGPDAQGTFDEAVVEMQKILQDSILPGTESLELEKTIRKNLSAALYARQTLDELNGIISHGGMVPGALNTSGKIVKSNNGAPVGAGIPAPFAGLLTALYSGESRGGEYNAQYTPQGSRPRYFTDFSKHPNQGVKITEGEFAGQSSTAAGAAQFIIGTWNEVVADLEGSPNPITDFSPESQDRGAIHLARKRYATATDGRDLLYDLTNTTNRQTFANVKQALSATWPSLNGMLLEVFINHVQGASGNPSSLMYDERFDALSNQEKLDIAASSNAQALAKQTVIQEQMESERTRQFDAVREALDNGTLSGQTALDQKMAAAGFDYDQRQNLQTQFNEVHKKELSAHTYITSVSNGAVDTQDSDFQQGANDFYASPQVQEVLNSGDQDAIAGIMRPIHKTGFVPKGLIDNLYARTANGSLSAQENGWNSLATLWAGNRIAAAKVLTNEQQADISMYDKLKSSEPLDELLATLRGSRDPAVAAAQDMRKTAFNTFISEEPEFFLPEQVFDRLGFDPALADVGQSDAMTAEYLASYRYAMIKWGNADVAAKSAMETVQSSWGEQTVLGSTSLSKFPIQHHFPPHDGTYDYVDEQATRDLGIHPGTPFQLVPDSVTNEQVGNQETPTYGVLVASSRGYMTPLLYEDLAVFEDIKISHEKGDISFEDLTRVGSTPVRWNPEITDEMREELAVKQQLATEAQHLREDISDARAAAPTEEELAIAEADPTTPPGILEEMTTARELADIVIPDEEIPNMQDVMRRVREDLGATDPVIKRAKSGFKEFLNQNFNLTPMAAIPPTMRGLRTRTAPIGADELVYYENLITTIRDPFQRMLVTDELAIALARTNPDGAPDTTILELRKRIEKYRSVLASPRDPDPSEISEYLEGLE